MPSACALPKLSFQRKVGILYCRADQGSEEEMYNNQEAGPAFMQFLTLLGDVVRLKGFESYRAQLDTKSKAQGLEGGAYLCCMAGCPGESELPYHFSVPYCPMVGARAGEFSG